MSSQLTHYLDLNPGLDIGFKIRTLVLPVNHMFMHDLYIYLFFRIHTLPETNIAPENDGFQ